MSKYNTNNASRQTRRANGEFSTKQRMATAAERNEAELNRLAVAASATHRTWLDNNGYSDIEADELFASAR